MSSSLRIHRRPEQTRIFFASFLRDTEDARVPRNDKRLKWHRWLARYVAEVHKVTSHSVSRPGVIAGRVLNPKGVVPFRGGMALAWCARGMTWRCQLPRKGTEDASQFSGSNVRRGNTFAEIHCSVVRLREWPEFWIKLVDRGMEISRFLPLC